MECVVFASNFNEYREGKIVLLSFSKQQFWFKVIEQIEKANSVEGSRDVQSCEAVFVCNTCVGIKLQ